MHLGVLGYKSSGSLCEKTLDVMLCLNVLPLDLHCTDGICTCGASCML